MKIRIAEIFESMSGEVGLFRQGSPTTFIRLAGCNLQCPFCDTKWANQIDGKEMTVEELINKTIEFPWKQVILTGGEPLVQREAVDVFVRELAESTPDILVQIETNGSLPITRLRADSWVVDYKGIDCMKGSEYEYNPGWVGGKNDWIKYLVGSLDDIDRALSHVESMINKGCRTNFAMSSVEGNAIRQVQEAILKSKLPIVLNVQLHKIIGVR